MNIETIANILGLDDMETLDCRWNGPKNEIDFGPEGSSSGFYAILNESNLGSIPEYSGNLEVQEEDQVVYLELPEEVIHPDPGSQADQGDNDMDIEQPDGDAEGEDEEDDKGISKNAIKRIENDDL